MDLLIVGIIVAGAVIFTVRGFIKVYKGEDRCGCSSGCSCPSKGNCDQGFPVADKK